AGVVAVRDLELAERLAFLQNAEGTALGPFECWLLLRGIKTLAVRAGRQQATARAVASWLAVQEPIVRVHYPGLASHPGSALHAEQARGPGSVLAFETGCEATSRRMVERLRLFH